MRGFIDDDATEMKLNDLFKSQSAFVRGFIDDLAPRVGTGRCRRSQSAFVRGFIDDGRGRQGVPDLLTVSIRVRARLHR